jgi:hypothetical protein
MSDSANIYSISYSELEQAGWPMSVIEDYQSFKRQVLPQHGVTADPNGVYRSNMNGFYVDTNLNVMWFNAVTGSSTGWVQVS